MLTVSELCIYPIKSLGGISVKSAVLGDRGLEHDRRWMLVDVNNRFISQRENASLALLQVTITNEGLLITHKIKGKQLAIPFEATGAFIDATIWDDTCELQRVNEEADAWFSAILNMSCSLVYMPDMTLRKADTESAFHGQLTSLSDGFPLLLVGQASLDDLNERLDLPIPMERFRPNIVFTGGLPYQEDEMAQFTINQIALYGVKPCARCPIPTIDQNTGIKSKEPLKTLATYRLQNHKVYFGQNVLYDGGGVINVGDLIKGKFENVIMH